MSYSIYLHVDTGGPEPHAIDPHLNYTYNVAPMWFECGLRLHDLSDRGVTAAEAARVIRDAIEKLRAEPERFRAMNPENGWGDYDRGLAWLEDVAAFCEEHPKAVFYVC